MKNLYHSVIGLAPIADAFSGTVYSDVVSMRNHKTAVFTVLKGVSAGADNGIVTVQACSNTTPSARTAVAFKYQECTSGDTWGVIKDAAAAGFSVTSGSAQLYKIYVDASVLAEVGYEFVQLKHVEVTDIVVAGAILVELFDSRDEKEIQETAIV